MKTFLPYAAALLLLASCSSDNTNKTAAVDSVIPAATDEKTQMSENALHFINDYVNNCNQNKPVGVLEWVNTSDLASDTLRAIVKKAVEEADKETGLEYDPIFNAQEYPEEGFDLEAADEANSVVYVKGKNNTKYVLKMQMIQENGVWKVGKCEMK
ncbi:MAG: DUF3828 domain-containing protein [Bacteroidia bacterium]|nr:DUF3828 domain-containing protein [Bacteroidia bacterium]